VGVTVHHSPSSECRGSRGPASRFCTHCGYSPSNVTPAAARPPDEERLRVQWGRLKRVGNSAFKIGVPTGTPT
jgi:hypothetical protein